MTYFSDFAIVTVPLVVMAIIGYVLGRIDGRHAQRKPRMEALLQAHMERLRRVERNARNRFSQ